MARQRDDTLTPRNAAARRKLTGCPEASSRSASRSRSRNIGSRELRRPRPGASRSSAVAPWR